MLGEYAGEDSGRIWRDIAERSGVPMLGYFGGRRGIEGGVYLLWELEEAAFILCHP